MLDSAPTTARPGASSQAALPPLLPLDVRGLRFTHADMVLIDGIDLTIRDNALTVILGPNGAGKTLLLRLLHGLIEPTSGTIKWGALHDARAARRRQAMVFQRPVLLRRSVAANVDFALALRHNRSPARRDALLAHVGLSDRAQQPARLLSGGEQQRLALARALATDPGVLFLDEPTASLDPASVAMIEDIVQGAKRAGTKVIFVTHDIAQARRLADEIVFLDAGRVAECGPAARFFDHPVTAAADAYLAGRIDRQNHGQSHRQADRPPDRSLV